MTEPTAAPDGAAVLVLYLLRYLFRAGCPHAERLLCKRCAL